MSRRTEQAYAELREQILSGKLEGGMRLGEEELAESLGISRTPVREALRRLAMEGLVEISSNRGARVPVWDDSDLDDIFQLRGHLESFGARKAAVNPDEASLAQLADWCNQMEACIGKRTPDLRTLAEINRKFHDLVIEMSGSRRLQGLVNSLVYVPIVMHTYKRYSPEALRRSVGHHRELVAALTARDGDWAQAVWTAHVAAARHELSGDSTAPTMYTN